ncbi:MAG: hypothetical protein ABIG69_06980 [Bacteroidota bacterium]
MNVKTQYKIVKISSSTSPVITGECITTSDSTIIPLGDIRDISLKSNDAYPSSLNWTWKKVKEAPFDTTQMFVMTELSKTLIKRRKELLKAIDNMADIDEKVIRRLLNERDAVRSVGDHLAIKLGAFLKLEKDLEFEMVQEIKNYIFGNVKSDTQMVSAISTFINTEKVSRSINKQVPLLKALVRYCELENWTGPAGQDLLTSLR